MTKLPRFNGYKNVKIMQCSSERTKAELRLITCLVSSRFKPRDITY